MTIQAKIREELAKLDWNESQECWIKDNPAFRWENISESDRESMRERADMFLSYLQSQGVVIKVKRPDCEWSQFVDEESVGMTPCYSCNSTGYLIEPLIKEQK